jgi:hypothetical protein
MAKTKATAPKDQQVVIQELGIQIRSNDRTPKDLARWKSALVSAENVQMPIRRTLYDLYEDIVLDEHLTSVMVQRCLALTNSTLVFQKDGKEVEAVQKLINTLAFESLCNHILQSKLWGYSLIHADFTTAEPTIELVPRPHVVPELGIVVANPGDMTGINYQEPPYTNLYVGVGEKKDLGLLLKAVPLVLLKRGNVSDWAAFNEVFGQPLRKGTYSPGDPAQKVQLEQALANMGQMSYVVVPEGSNLEIIGNYQTASATTYSMLTEHFDKAISKLIVGQTMTTESGASLSQSEVHERVAGKIGVSDRRFLIKVLESRIKPLLIAQGIPADGNFQFMDEEAEVSKKDRLEGDLKIHEKVGKLPKTYWSNEYNVEFANPSDNEKQEPEANPEPAAEDEPEGKTKTPEQPDKPEKEKPAGKQNNSIPLAGADHNGSQYSIREFVALVKDFFRKAPIRS